MKFASGAELRTPSIYIFEALFIAFEAISLLSFVQNFYGIQPRQNYLSLVF